MGGLCQVPRSDDRRHKSTIVRVLRRIDRKIRLNGLMEQLSVSLCLALGLLLMVRITDLLVPITTPSVSTIWVSGMLFFVVFLFWSRLHIRRLGRAAGVADMYGGLNDEMKTAHWFISQKKASPWIELQIKRAEKTANQLDASLLVPVVLPRRLWAVLALSLGIQGLALLPVEGPLLSFAAAADSTSLADSERQRFEDIREVLEADDGELLTEEARDRLEDVLEKLQAEDMSLEELLRDLREAQDELDKGNLQMNAMRDALDEMSEELAGSEQLAPFAEALRNRDLDEAADVMRELSDLLSEMDGSEASEMLEQLKRASGDQASMEEFLEAIEEAAEALAKNQMADAEQALQKAADAVERMAEQQSTQEGRNEASQQMQSLQQSMEQQEMARQIMMQMQTAEGAEASESAEVGLGVQSDEVQRSAGGESGDQNGPPGNSTSDPSGEGQLELGESTTLEVQLAMELLDETEPRREEEIDPEDIFQEASRQQASTVEFRDVRSLSNYAEGSALQVEHIPWRFRSLVKKYFLAIRPQERQ